MNPIAFEFHGIEIRWYSIFILFAIFIAYILITREAKRFKISTDFMFNMLFWVIIFGIIGARIYYVIFNLDAYLENPSEIYKIWHGGLAIHGGIIAGILTIVFYCKKYKCNILKIFDIIAPSLLLAQAIGRWGNFFNSEAYGSIVSYNTLLKIKIIPQFIIDNMYIEGAYHLPTFYFESILCFIGFLIMIIVRRKKYIKVGSIFAMYLMWYGIIRSFIEIFRSDSLMIGNVKMAIVISIIMIIISIYIFVINIRKPQLDDLYNKAEEIKF